MQALYSRIRRFFTVTLFFVLITRFKEKTIRKMFCRVCELDFDEPMNFGWFQLMAYGGSASIECQDGYKFVMNDSPHGVKVLSLKDDKWTVEYETGMELSSLRWFEKFKLIYDTLVINDVFTIMQKQNLEKAKKGIMN